MTSTTTNGVPAEKQRLLIELTGFELLSLLAISREEGARRTREVLRLPDVAADSPLLTAGVSSLLVRKLAEMRDDGGLQPLGNLDALVTVLTKATQWIEASGVAGRKGADREVGTAILVGSPFGGVLLEPRPFSVWHAWPLPMPLDMPAAGASFVKAQFENLTRRPFAGSLKLTEASGSRVAAVHMNTEGRWELAKGPADTVPTATATEADPSFRVLAEAMA